MSRDQSPSEAPEAKVTAEALLGAFRVFDTDAKGVLDRKRIAEIMRMGGNFFTDQQVEEMLKDIPSTSAGVEYIHVVNYLLEPKVLEKDKKISNLGWATAATAAAADGLMQSPEKFQIELLQKQLEENSERFEAEKLELQKRFEGTDELRRQLARAKELEDQRGELESQLQNAEQRAMEEARRAENMERLLEEAKARHNDKAALEEQNARLTRQVQYLRLQQGSSDAGYLCPQVVHMTLKERPPVVDAKTVDITYHGSINPAEKECVVSFPGKYATGWDALVESHHGYSVACVFLCTAKDGLGEHAPDPDAADGSCYCRKIYGDRGYELYLKKYKHNVSCTEEKLQALQSNAAAMHQVLIREDATDEERNACEEQAKANYEEFKQGVPWGCMWFVKWMEQVLEAVKNNQQLIVVNFPGQAGAGHVIWDGLAKADLWNNEGLGGSQKAEVAWLDLMKEKFPKERPGFFYIEKDVSEFLQEEFRRELTVDALDKETKKWRRGHILSFSVKDGDKRDGKRTDKITVWTVECSETKEQFDSVHLRHTSHPICTVLQDVDEKLLLEKLRNAFEGLELDIQLLKQARLRSGVESLAATLRIHNVEALHKLRDMALNGTLDQRLNEQLAGIKGAQGDFEVQIDKTEFFYDYERSLSVMSKMTEHQKECLKTLEEHKDAKELHLSAPPGAGKTFVAVQYALDTLYGKDGTRILYVGPGLALGLSFLHWLLRRHEVRLIMEGGEWDEEVEKLLRRVVLLYPPYEKAACFKVEAGRLVEEDASSTDFALAVLDESQVIFDSDQMKTFYKSLKAEKRLILSDASQASSLTTENFDGAVSVRLTEVVRSTKRIVAGALAFQGSVADDQKPSCCGTDGPALKSYIFESQDDPFEMYCEHIKSAIFHIFKTYPSLSNLHRRAAIIVPDGEFLAKLKGPLEEKLRSTFTSREFLLSSFEESLRCISMHESLEAVEEVRQEVIVLDTAENCRGMEALISISVGLDEPISGSDTEARLGRARIYVGISRGQLMAIVINAYVQSGWLEFLKGVKLKKEQFHAESAMGEVSPKAARSVIEKEEEEKRTDTGAVTEAEEASETEPRTTKESEAREVTADVDGQALVTGTQQDQEAKEEAKAPEKSVEEEPKESFVWDTESNDISPTAKKQKLKFDPLEANAAEAFREALRARGLAATVEEAHGGKYVYCVCTVNAETFASGGTDSKVKLWRLRGSELTELYALEGHTSGVWALELMDEDTLCSGANDQTVRVWSLRERRMAAVLTGHTNSVYALAKVDATRLASGSDDKTIKVWNIQSKKCLQTLEGHSNWVRALTLLGPERLVSGSDDATLKVWNVSSDTCTATLRGHTGYVLAVAKLDSSTVASGADDKSVRIWSTETATCLRTLAGHENIVRCLAPLHPQVLASGGNDKTLRIWNVETEQCVQVLRGHSNTVRGLARVGNALVSCGEDGTLRVWT